MLLTDLSFILLGDQMGLFTLAANASCCFKELVTERSLTSKVLFVRELVFILIQVTSRRYKVSKTPAALYSLVQNVSYRRNSDSSKTSSTEDPVIQCFEITNSNSSNFGAVLYTPFNTMSHFLH